MKSDGSHGSLIKYDDSSAVAVLRQTRTLLARAFRLSSKARNNEALDALLVIRNDVEAITKIIDRHKHFFRHPRVHLLPLGKVNLENGSSASGISAIGLSSIDQTVVKVEPAQPIADVKFEHDNAIANPYSVHSGEEDGGISPLPSWSFDDERGSSPPASPLPRRINFDGAERKAVGNASNGHFVEDFCRICEVKLGGKTKEDETKIRIDHMKRYHPDKVFLCDCDALFFDEMEMKNHFNHHSDATINKLIKDSSCPVCGLKFLDENGNLTKEVEYFWVQKGAESFVTKHLEFCDRKKNMRSTAKCNYCPEYVKRWCTQQHLTEKHKEHMVQCSICEEWHDKATLSYHKYKRHTRPQKKVERMKQLAEMKFEYHCKYCEDSVSVPHVSEIGAAKKFHMISRHTNEMSRCVCGVYVLDDDDVASHVKEHPEMNLTKLADLVKISSCPTCGLRFLDDDKNMTEDLKYFWFERNDANFVDCHLKQCLESNTYRKTKNCSLCGCEVRRYLYWRHLVECHKLEIEKCDICGFWFRKKYLHSHRSSKHNVIGGGSKKSLISKVPLGRKKRKTEKGMFVCSTCGDVFLVKKEFDYHKQVHYLEAEKKKKIQCQYCDEMVSLLHISRHEMDHLEVPELIPCSLCSRTLRGEKAYRKHVKSHEYRKNKAKEFCKICQKEVSDLKSHVRRMHQFRERFKCAECGNTFAEKRHLLRHEMLHTKAYAFNCAFCGKGYNVKCALEYHEDTVHKKVKRYICQAPGCGESFFVNLYLRRHVKKMHPK